MVQRKNRWKIQERHKSSYQCNNRNRSWNMNSCDLTRNGIHTQRWRKFIRQKSGKMHYHLHQNQSMEYKRNRMRYVSDTEDFEARICLDKICEFLRQRPDNSMWKTNMSVKDYTLEQFQWWIGKKITSPNGNIEYEKYRKKYRQQKKITTNLSK